VKLLAITPPADLPVTGARIPGFAVRVALMITGALLTVVGYGVSGWLAVGIVLSVASAWLPRYLLGWALILFLAAGQLAREPALNWRLLVLLAGLHLLHVLAMLALELPWRAWVQPAVFQAPLQRFLVIQAPSQLLAILALLLLAPSHAGHRPLTVAGFAVVGTLALAAVGMLLFGPGSDDNRSP